MPRPNKRRAIFAEDHLAARIAAERDAHGWTNDGLAHRMTLAGCPMTGSAIFKIEKAEPRRRIVVDELVAFAKVFGLPLDELLLPPEVAASKEVARLVVEWNRADDAAVSAIGARDAAWETLQGYVAAHPESTGALEKVLKTWAALYFEDEHRVGAVAYRMAKLTGSAEWEQRLRQDIDRDLEGGH